MKHQYDLFEKFPDGSSLWRACVIGLDGARHHMSELAQRSSNRFYAMHIASGRIVLQNVRGALMHPTNSVKRSNAAAA